MWKWQPPLRERRPTSKKTRPRILRRREKRQLTSSGGGRRDKAHSSGGGCYGHRHTKKVPARSAVAARCVEGRPPEKYSKTGYNGRGKVLRLLVKAKAVVEVEVQQKKKKKGPHEAKFVLLITIASSRPRLGAAWPRTQQRVLTEGGQCKGSSREMM